MSLKIALAGNPNCGKTTMFNDLTGSSQYVGNWPGVTVEKKEGKLKGQKDIIIQDLPGIYSLSPYTLEEVVSRNYLINDKPDAIVNIVDSTNIERNLFLTTQLIEIGLPVVIALNMIDLLEKNGDIIDTKNLSKLLGCEVIETSALKGIGSREVVEKAVSASKRTSSIRQKGIFSEEIETALEKIGDLIKSKLDGENIRWYSIKVFERDSEIMKQIKLDESTKSEIESIIDQCEADLDDDSESIITDSRYIYITDITKKCVKHKNRNKESVSDKIDKIVTNRILALPIFAAIMFLIYYISISTVGTWMTDWVNDSLFGDSMIPAVIGNFLDSVGTAEWLNSLILDGIIAGVGAVLGFLPQMLTLFLCLAILEDCGYMARIAFIMDRVFKKFGLSGKSFIPILIGTGCGVPGIMASRTIENESDRRMTIITTTFIPCGAKLPIIALIAGALFPGSAWVAPSAYFIGIAAIITSGIILKKMKPFAGNPAPFVLELPPYHMPAAKSVLIHMWDRGKAFVKKAGSIILLASVLIWFLSTFNWSMQMVDTNESMLASLGKIIAPLFAPLGWGNWKAAVASITGLIAKENVVGTFGVLYGYAEVAEDGLEYWATLRAEYTQLAAYSFLVFNLLCAPCFAAIGAVRREMMSAKWTWFAIAYQTGFAYIVSLTIYQLGMFFTGNGFGFGTAVAILILITFIYLLFKKSYTPEEKVKTAASHASR
ncbi:ferrous iron transport protein B [Metaclostridioides mangenotii]|uniref:ferrous iron transport protein B n=1 Tax=Metaclostridioides mangenotii TaxID=1540 RepID=UPI0028EACEC2|nr:ferrous iron transport protein B [Clostridioides mangenotii]